MRSRTVLVGAVAVLVILGVGALWFTGRGSIEEVDLDRAVADLVEAEAGRAEQGEDGPHRDVVVDATGTWVIDGDAVPFSSPTGTGSFVGYRIDEELSGRGAVVAVGRTPLVEGEILIDGSRVTAADVRADLSGLESDNRTRDLRVAPLLRDRPVSFTLTRPFDFAAVPEAGQRVVVTAVGVLRIGDIEQEATFELSAEVVGQRLFVGGSTVVTLADFDLRVPSVPVLISVSDEATIELQLYLSRG